MLYIIFFFIFYWCSRGIENGYYLNYADHKSEHHDDESRKGFHLWGTLNACLITAFVMFMAFTDAYEVTNWYRCLIIPFNILSLRWIFYDLAMNATRGIRWNFTGTTARIDRMAGGTFGIVAKAVLLAIVFLTIIF